MRALKLAQRLAPTDESIRQRLHDTFLARGDHEGLVASLVSDHSTVDQSLGMGRLDLEQAFESPFGETQLSATARRLALFPSQPFAQ